MYLSPPSLLLFSFCLSKKSEYKGLAIEPVLPIPPGHEKNYFHARLRNVCLHVYIVHVCIIEINSRVRSLSDTRRVTPRNRSNTG